MPAVPVVPSAQTSARRADQAPATHQPVPAAAFQAPVVVFQPPDLTERRPAGEPSRSRQDSASGAGGAGSSSAGSSSAGSSGPSSPAGGDGAGDDSEGQGGSRRRRRGGRGRGKGSVGGDPAASGQGGSAGQAGNGQGGSAQASASSAPAGAAGSGGGDRGSAGERTDPGRQAAGRTENGRGTTGGRAEGGEPGDDEAADGDSSGGSSSRRRRRRRQRGSGAAGETDVSAPDDPTDTVVHVREPRPAVESDDVRSVKGSTRLEAKRQRRRESRDTGRRRPPIISESEFLARREAVERVMLVRQQGDRTQIAVLEDGILVEHYVDKASHQSYVGNVYLGKVQNVLPSMEAAFVDVGKGRNAVLYAGEVNFDASGLEGVAKRIESALKSGQSIMVQVTKDPIGHKGARLTSQVSLPGRYLVYVPGASMTGISRKLPDTERARLKQILKKVAPEEGGIIVRTAAEGASEEELVHDVTRLVAQWQAIERKAKTANAPDLLYGEPDLTIRVVRDIFNEDFTRLVIASDSEWDLVDEYVRYVAPNLSERLERWTDDEPDMFSSYRIDEQLAKALDRKVWLPSGGSLVIDTTEAMTVIDVNTGKFTGQGGNLEQTVTRNNLEAAEEIVRQLRLRDIGGIIVIDFIDMVLESNRDLVLRRLIECLARDRTKHQVAEVTSLGLVQMTRKRVGSGLLAAFSVPCEHCTGRGVLISTDLTEISHSPGRNGQQGSGPRPAPARTRSARSKAIAQVAAKTLEPPSAPQDDPSAASGQPQTSAAQAGPDQSDADQAGAAQAGAAQAGADGQVLAGEEPLSEEAAGPAAPRTAGGRSASTRSASTRSRRSETAARAAEPSSNGSAPATETADSPEAAIAVADADAAPEGTGTGPVNQGTEEDAAPPRRRTRRSAYREAGPPDSAQSASSAPQAGDGSGDAGAVSAGSVTADPVSAGPVTADPVSAGPVSAGAGPDAGEVPAAAEAESRAQVASAFAAAPVDSSDTARPAEAARDLDDGI